MGFLDSALDFLGGISDLAAPWIPQVPLPTGGATIEDIVRANATPPILGAPAVQAGVGSTIVRNLPGLGVGLGIDWALGGFEGGGGGGKTGGRGVQIAGNTPGLYHTTPSGRRIPNRISFAQDDSGRADFFVYAGNPTAWSRVSLKKSRPRHHHHPR